MTQRTTPGTNSDTVPLWRQGKIDRLLATAAALEVSHELVTVELSLPVAWLLRDLIGFGHLADRARIDGPGTTVPMIDDMGRLNAVVGSRPLVKEPHVSSWSKLAVERLSGEAR